MLLQEDVVAEGWCERRRLEDVAECCCRRMLRSMDLDKGGTEGVCWRRMFKEDGERGWIWRMVVLKENGVQYGM